MEDRELVRIIYSPDLRSEGIKRLFSLLLKRCRVTEQEINIDIEFGDIKEGVGND